MPPIWLTLLNNITVALVVSFQSSGQPDFKAWLLFIAKVNRPRAFDSPKKVCRAGARKGAQLAPYFNLHAKGSKLRALDMNAVILMHGHLSQSHVPGIYFLDFLDSLGFLGKNTPSAILVMIPPALPVAFRVDMILVRFCCLTKPYEQYARPPKRDTVPKVQEITV